MKKTLFISISLLFFMFPFAVQAIMLPSSNPVLTNASIITDAYGNPEAIEVTGAFLNDCTRVTYDQVNEMENTTLVQVFLESVSSFCPPAYLPFTHIVELDSIPQGASITVGLYNGIAAEKGITQVYGDPVVLEGIVKVSVRLDQISVDIVPAVLNLKSRGRFVTASIELPAEYVNENMVLVSALLDGGIAAEKTYLNDDGIFIAKFDRSQVIEYISDLGLDFPVKLELALQLEFAGEKLDLTVQAKDTIKVVNGKNKKDKRN